MLRDLDFGGGGGLATSRMDPIAGLEGLMDMLLGFSGLGPRSDYFGKESEVEELKRSGLRKSELRIEGPQCEEHATLQDRKISKERNTVGHLEVPSGEGNSSLSQNTSPNPLGEHSTDFGVAP